MPGGLNGASLNRPPCIPNGKENFSGGTSLWQNIWKPFTFGSSNCQQCHSFILSSRHQAGDPGTSSPLHACFWVHEVVKVLRVMHMWHIILSCDTSSYHVFLPVHCLHSSYWMGYSMQNFDYCWQTLEGAQTRKFHNNSKFSWSIRFLCICQDSKDLIKIIVLWMTACKRKGNLSRMLPFFSLGFLLGFWVWFFFFTFKANTYICTFSSWCDPGRNEWMAFLWKC